mgnify:CR=1 FL=1
MVLQAELVEQVKQVLRAEQVELELVVQVELDRQVVLVELVV